ncbi:MAG TPA: MBL fold metallo-hydrolase [Candidatus Dormibacteraeota bacterium]|jgi:glyoxylase-like metal-dependent hydrolase (beta-lactamase superfamily II)|nr:MBL fold metallo-hydrolase [Candidatus Dormibacteraeota bacterium]
MPQTHLRNVTRRQFLVSSGFAASAFCFAPRYSLERAADTNLVVAARSGAAKAKVEIQKIRGNISVLMGVGGNIAVLPGSDGKLLVDSGMGDTRSSINDALAAISADPVKHLVNTHWHFDHTDGNEWVHAVGAAILAHENTRKHLSTATRVDDWDFNFPARPAGAIPTEVLSTKKTFHLNGETIHVEYYGPAHTDSDISVHFVNADVLHTGDTWWNGVYPFVDYSTGGSINAAIRAAEANIAKVSAKTTVIPGHGPVGEKSQLVEFRDTLATIRNRVASLKKQGRTLNETVAAKPTASFDAKWAGFLINGDFFTKLVYIGV